MRPGPSAIAIGLACLSTIALSLAPRAQSLPAERIDYDRQIKPIFEQSCYECHGPSKSRGRLRLHDRTLALKGGDSGPVIVPGHSADSLLMQRVRGLGDDDQMPLKKAALSETQIATLAAWIDQGAVWPDATGAPAGTAQAGAAAEPEAHWAYLKPRRPALPPVNQTAWVRNPIDQFVLARLEHEGLKPSAEAAKTTLLRRVTLDLIGLPPTLDELDAFLADTRPDAYARVVDRLLASPHFGERWARPWLDLARYADSNGYEKDNRRAIWSYRDWVIDALNADMPFDQFTIEQIAGDMLPNSTTAQWIATGFHRNAMTNEEGGVDPDESLFEVLVDRVNTTSTVWLGSTIGCAQCHNHKYDPFSQKDYYRLMAFFQNTDYTSKTFGDGTRYFEGQIELATPDQKTRRTALELEIAKHEAAMKAKTPALTTAQATWEQRLREASAAWTAVKPESLDATGGVTLTAQPDDTVVASGANPALTTYTIVATTPLSRITAVRLEALPDASLPKGGPGRDPYGHFRLTHIAIDAAPAHGAAAPASPPSQPVIFTKVKVDDGVEKIDAEALLGRERMREAPLKRSATPLLTLHTPSGGRPVRQPTARVETERDEVPARKGASWTIDAIKDETRVPRQAVLVADRPFGFAGGTRVTIRLSHLDGAIGQGLGRFRLSLTTTSTPELIVDIPARLRPALTRPAAQRTPKQTEDLATRFRRDTPLLARTRDALAASRKAWEDLRIPTTLVMREKATFERPSTHLRERGAFNARGALLYASVPAALHPMPESQPMNRLGLARWLVDPNNPLVSRVTVNRLWEQLFGRGLVETSEDFGTQGTPPSHADLLDWLATELVAQKWSQKALLKTMVMSATYRQDSRVTPALLEKDPYNRLLARGSRFRLEAELIRDTALASAGLLSAKMHGPSVFPPQPEGVWNNPFSSEKWTTSTGEDRYRRSLYTFLRRTAPYPTFIALDATSREYCTVRRVRTNTPLQALALLNDEVYVEAAVGLAGRVLGEAGAGDSVDTRLTYAMRLTVSRPPDPRELARLRSLLETESRYYAAHPQDARRLIDAAADDAVQTSASALTDHQAAERAAWTIVSNVLLNLDEVQTRE